MKTVIIDIETFLDEEAAERSSYITTNEFAPFPLHRVVCASALSVTTSATGEQFYALESFSCGAMGERGIIMSLEAAVVDANVVISFNGYRFDLSVLLTRAMVDEVHVPRLIGRSGFPDGVNAGRGFRGGYTFEQFWQIFMLLHLQTLGLPLGAAIKLVQAHWVLASAPIDLAFEDAANDLQMTFLWVVQPAGALPGEASVTKGSFSTLGLLPGQALQDETNGGAHFAAINASTVIRKATSALATDAAAKTELLAAHRLWRQEVNVQLRDRSKSETHA